MSEAYIVRLLTIGDETRLDDFLRSHTAEAYYIRSNARIGGLAYEGKFYQAEYIGAFHDDHLVGVISYSWLNTILVYADDLDCLPGLSRLLIPFLQKRLGVVDAILGLAQQVNIVIDTLGIPPDAFLDREPDGLFRLSIERLCLPDLLKHSDYVVRRATTKDIEHLVSWRIAFNMEAMAATPGSVLENKVRKEVTQRVELRELFVLEKDGTILSFCGAGGYVPDMIMIGPVWTPSELRNRGYGRAVTAGAISVLSSERQDLKWVVLFARKPDAIHMYTILGFERISDWRLALMKEGYKLQSGKENLDS